LQRPANYGGAFLMRVNNLVIHTLPALTVVFGTFALQLKGNTSEGKIKGDGFHHIITM